MADKQASRQPAMPAVAPSRTGSWRIQELCDEDNGMGISGVEQQLDGSNMPVQYLKRHGSDIHEALDMEVNATTFSKRRGTFEIIKTPNVKAALEWYQKTNSDVQFDVFNCSWDDVFAQMERAKSDYQNKGSKEKNIFRYLWRKAGTKKEAIEPWLQLIPDEYGLSIARGAIGIVFHIAEQSREKDDKILAAFEEITDTIHNAMSKGVAFRKEPDMHKCIQELYDSLIEGVADLVWSLKPEVEGKNFFDRHKKKQERRKGIEVEALLRKVKRKSDELNLCAERIMAKHAAETNRGVGQLEKEAVVMQSIMINVQTGQEGLQHAAIEQGKDVRTVKQDVKYLGAAAANFAQDVDEKFRDLSQKAEKIMAENQELRKAIKFAEDDRHQIIEAARSQNATLAIMQEVLLKMDTQQYDEDRRRSMTPLGDTPPVTIPLYTLIEIVNVSLKLANDDLHAALFRSGSYNSKEHHQAQSMMATPRFQNWMTLRNSDLILVDGNNSGATRGSLSPMSLMCASLSAALEQTRSRSAIIMHFFCGLHNNEDDPAAGPVGMVRALLAQLASSLLREDIYSGNLGYVNESIFWQGLHNHRLDELCYVLGRLLYRLPASTTVFCLIDGISAFEQDSFRNDLTYVVWQLQRFAMDSRRPAPFKVLLTSPYRSMHLAPEGVVDGRDHIVLEAGAGRGGRGYLTGTTVASFL